MVLPSDGESGDGLAESVRVSQILQHCLVQDSGAGAIMKFGIRDAILCAICAIDIGAIGFVAYSSLFWI